MEWKELISRLDQLRDLGPLFSGVIGLIGAVIAFMASLINLAARAMFGSAAYPGSAPGPGWRLSLKSILKGWISTIIWTVIVFTVFWIVIAQLIRKEASRFAPPAPIAGQPAMAQQRELTMEEANQVLHSYLLRHQQAQIIMLILGGCVYCRGAYVAARSAKTTTLLKLTHGLVAIATFEIGLRLLIQSHFPELMATTAPSLVTQHGWTAILTGCTAGAILGSED